MPGRLVGKKYTGTLSFREIIVRVQCAFQGAPQDLEGTQKLIRLLTTRGMLASVYGQEAAAFSMRRGKPGAQMLCLAQPILHYRNGEIRGGHGSIQANRHRDVSFTTERWLAILFSIPCAGTGWRFNFHLRCSCADPWLLASI